MKRSRGNLSRDDWAAAALGAIEEGGVSAVAVEPLAKTLGVTKGSFYWHFEDRRELLLAALDQWERQFTLELTAEMETPAKPREQLRALIRRGFIEFEPAVLVRLTQASDDPAVAAVLARLAEMRVSQVAGAFEDIGLEPEQARSRALLAYSAFLGFAQLRERMPAEFKAEKRRVDFANQIEAQLLGDI